MTPSSQPPPRQVRWIMVCHAGHEWVVTTAGQDPPPSRCPQCGSCADDYKRLPETQPKTAANPTKYCGCSRSYSIERFRKLPYVATWEIPAMDGLPALTMELRNCVCGSSIAIGVDPQGNVVVE